MANPLLGSLTSVNLIAGAGILGNIGGVAIAANTGLTANISSYTTVGVVEQYANIVATGFVTYNEVSNIFPALTNGVPTAYQSSLSNSSSMTAVITAQSNKILGTGDLGKFEQVFSTSFGYVTTYNQFIASTINANNSNATLTFTSQDNTITGGLSDLTIAFSTFSDDLARTGILINFENLNNLGSPAALLEQIASLGYDTPELRTALLNAGLTAEQTSDLANASWTLAQQKAIYRAMTQITGKSFDEIKKLLKVTTSGLTNMADLLNPVKIFPQSFNTFTAPTKNGLRAIYINQSGAVNSRLETELPESVLVPLQGNESSGITYSQLRSVIPPDQALANKALTAGLQQVKLIFNTRGPYLSVATQNLETNKGLNYITSLTSPMPADVYNYFSSTFATGTGEDGLFLLTDFVGTPTGWVMNDALGNTVAVLNTMTSANAFGNLTNAYNGVYVVMANTANGDYTGSSNVANVVTWYTDIPTGLPGSGNYIGNTANASIQAAFDDGLISNMIANVTLIATNNSTLVAQANTNWNNICSQIVMENNNLANAGVDFANLVPGVSPTSLVTNLTEYGLNTVEGGAAFVLESLATNTQGGQAIVATMRQGRNQVRLSDAGIETTEFEVDVVQQPQATLTGGQYTASEAASQKII